jgi:hypothetical protein
MKMRAFFFAKKLTQNIWALNATEEKETISCAI